MNALRQHRSFFILLCLAATLFLSDIWAFREFVRAESYFALGAKLMIEEGNWLTPHAADELPLNKPPLTYWLIGVSYKLFGVNYGAARLPSAMAALATLALIYFLGRKPVGEHAALLAAGILGTSYLFMNFARMAMSDMLLTFFLTASLLSLINVLTASDQRSSRMLYLGYAALGLAVLTKGPVALALLVLPIAFELLCSWRREDLRRLRIVRGLALTLIIAAPYFLLVYFRAGPEPLHFFFVGENLKRFTGEIYSASAKSFWYEFVALFGDFAPWSLLIPVALLADVRRRREGLTRRPKRILYLWLAATSLLFSISSFKLDYYLLPAMPAAALIVGVTIAQATEPPFFVRHLVKLFLAISALAMIAVSMVSLRLADTLSVHGLVRFLPIIVAMVGAFTIAHGVRRRSPSAAALVLCLCIAFTMLSLELTLLPPFLRFLPAQNLVLSVQGNRRWFTSRAAVSWANDLEFNLPGGSTVARLFDDETLLQALRDDPHAVALIQEQEYERLAGLDGKLKILGRAETFGHGGPRLEMLRNARREALLLIGR